MTVKKFAKIIIPTQVFINADGSPYYLSEEIASLIQFSMYSHIETAEHVFTTHCCAIILLLQIPENKIVRKVVTIVKNTLRPWNSQNPHHNQLNIC